MNNQVIKPDWRSNLKPTKHFIERYYERILEIYLDKNFDYKKAINKIFRDMNKRLLEREKNFLTLFVSPKCDVIVPLGRVNQLVIREGRLITVMN